MINKIFQVFLLISAVRLNFSQKISPHGGFLSIDEGSDFFLECLGEQAQWIVAKRLTLDAARISTFVVEKYRKSILSIQGMDQSLVGPYLCQANGSVSTVVLQLTKRQRVLSKQIRFMGTNNNHSVPYGSDLRLNCYAQFYSEKAMDSPYIPRILWFFERKQIFDQEEKYLIGADSLLIRNLTGRDQGVYYCRAFITLRANFLTKIYPIFVEISNEKKFLEENFSLPIVKNKICDENSDEIVDENRTISYCNVDGEISRMNCGQDEFWQKEFSSCATRRNSNENSILEIFPNLDEINVELGRIYTFLCRSKNENFLVEWLYENRTSIRSNSSRNEPITSYSLNNNRTVYLRLSVAFEGTFICRSRPLIDGNANDKEKNETSISIKLKAQTIAERTGISFQSSTPAEFHLRRNGTLFIACRPEYFDFQSTKSIAHVPQASLRRENDLNYYKFSENIDGLLIDRIDHDQSGLYICIGKLPLKDRLITAVYPVMVFVSDS